MKIAKIQTFKLPQYTRTYDLFICSSSYEERCLTIASALKGFKPRVSFVFEASDLVSFVHSNTEKLKNVLGKSFQLVPIDTRNPLFTADGLIQVVQTINGSRYKRILIDITTFTHEALLILLQLIRIKVTKAAKKRITFAYNSASDYSVGDDIARKWLSKGVREVRTVLGYPGNSLPSKKTHLIVLVGYEDERAAKLIEIIEPNTISLGYGRSSTSTTDKNKDANEHFHHLVKRMAASYIRVENFEISCNDPLQTRDVILRIARKAKGKNILLAPMNNKMSTLGAALASFDMDDIQVCYAPVLQYNFSRYSSPSPNCYLIELPELSA